MHLSVCVIITTSTLARTKTAIKLAKNIVQYSFICVLITRVTISIELILIHAHFYCTRLVVQFVDGSHSHHKYVQNCAFFKNTVIYDYIVVLLCCVSHQYETKRILSSILIVIHTGSVCPVARIKYTKYFRVFVQTRYRFLLDFVICATALFTCAIYYCVHMDRF